MVKMKKGAAQVSFCKSFDMEGYLSKPSGKSQDCLEERMQKVCEDTQKQRTCCGG